MLYMFNATLERNWGCALREYCCGAVVRLAPPPLAEVENKFHRFKHAKSIGQRTNAYAVKALRA